MLERPGPDAPRPSPIRGPSPPIRLACGRLVRLYDRLARLRSERELDMLPDFWSTPNGRHINVCSYAIL